MHYEVGLSNEQCLFDSNTFNTLDEALAFASGRGGTYTVNISSFDSKGDMIGSVHLSASDTGSDTLFKLFDCVNWTPISRSDIEKYV